MFISLMLKQKCPSTKRKKLHKIIDLYKEFNLERKENQRGIFHLFTKQRKKKNIHRSDKVREHIMDIFPVSVGGRKELSACVGFFCGG